MPRLAAIIVAAALLTIAAPHAATWFVIVCAAAGGVAHLRNQHTPPVHANRAAHERVADLAARHRVRVDSVRLEAHPDQAGWYPTGRRRGHLGVGINIVLSDDAHFEAVVAHELGHAHQWTLIASAAHWAARIGAAVGAAHLISSTALAVATSATAVVAIEAAAAAWMRRCEHDADRYAAVHADARTLLDGIDDITPAGWRGRLERIWSTHPDARSRHARLAALGTVEHATATA